MSGAEIAAEVAAAIKEASAEVGDGTPQAGTIIKARTGVPVENGGQGVTPGGEFACTVLTMSYGVMDRANTNIGMSDLKVMIAPDAEAAPTNGDELCVGGKEFSLSNVMPYQPGGVVLYYTATASGSGNG